MTPTLTARLDAALYVLHLHQARLPIAIVRDVLRKRGLSTGGTVGVFLVRLYEDMRK